MKFFIKNFFSKYDQETTDLVRFTEETLNGKLHFLSSDCTYNKYHTLTLSVAQVFIRKYPRKMFKKYVLLGD